MSQYDSSRIFLNISQTQCYLLFHQYCLEDWLKNFKLKLYPSILPSLLPQGLNTQCMIGTGNVKQNPGPYEPSFVKNNDPSFQDGLDFFQVLIMVASVLRYLCAVYTHIYLH